MATSWSLTRERIADKALEHCGVLGVGKVANFEDRYLAIETLDGILKELPLYGYTWPKISSAQASITLVAATNPTALPADYYGSPSFQLIDANAKEVPFRIITLYEWQAEPEKTKAGGYPEKGYIDQTNRLWTWPVQSANRTLKIFYQKVVDDTVASTAPDISVPFVLGLAYGVAAGIGDAFGISETKIQRWEAKWALARARGINASISYQPIRIEVND